LNKNMHGFKISNHMIAFGIFLGSLIWIGESIVKTTLSPEKTLIREIFTPDAHDLWMRLISVSILILFGIFTHTLISRNNRAEAHLRKGEQNYRSFVETLADIVFTLDLEGRFTYVNPQSESITGVPAQELLGTVFIDILSPEYHKFALDGFRRGIAGDKTPTYEMEIVAKENMIPIEVNATTLWNDEGQAIGRIGVARDITVRKQVESALRESEEKFRVLAKSTPTAIMLYQDDCWVYANPAAETISGYSEAELKTMNFWDIVHPDYQDLIQVRGNSRQKGLPAESRYEFKILSKEGKEIWVDLSGAETMINGRLAGIISVMDITERRKAEQAILESEQKYRTILDSIEDGYFEIDLAGSMVFNNKQLRSLSGYTREELSGINYQNYTTPEWHGILFNAFHEVYTTGRTLKQLEWEAITKDGTIMSLDTSVSLILDADGSPKGFRGIARDITQRKRLEAQLYQAQKMEAIGTLAGGIAHDFNNLLMAIQGYASLMGMDIAPDHPHQKMIGHIEKCVFSGSDLTKQLLGFARGGKYEVKNTDLNDLVQKSSDMFGHTKKEIQIHRKYEDVIWGVAVDQGQIEQVMLNLYVNAWQAMPEGGELFIETANVVLSEQFVRTYQVKPGRYVKVSIMDTGVGMDKETTARIFDPFFTTKDLSGSSGLGLASAYGIIRNHEGIINVYSEEGHGTTFTIYLPASGKNLISQEKHGATEILKGDETILLVDDEDMIIHVGADILKRLGYEVLTANGGEQAIGIFTKNKDSIDMVILDMIMPGMGGSETYSRLREIKDDVKVILSSGYSLNGQAADILKRGCNGFIQKPFDMQSFSRKIREVLA